MDKIEAKLGVIQETLLIPLWARATELQQTEPIIVDRESAKILEAIDYDFNKFAKSKKSQAGCCIRGVIFDRWVQNYLKKYPQGTVVEIGAGLNTRFERVDNGSVSWFDLDLPDVMALRRQFFSECDRRQFISASALETSWCDRVKAAAKEPCFFMAEGVLMYLKEAEVKQLFARLLEHFPGSSFVFDSISPFMIRNQKYHDSLKYTSAKMSWGIASLDRLLEWDSRYRILEVCKFSDLPTQYLRRFSLFDRFLFTLPFLRDTYRLALVQLG